MTTPAARPAPYRLAIVCSHAIQYLAPWFRALAQSPRLDVTVLYGDDHGLTRGGHDPGFGRDVRWDVDLLSGYRSERLRNDSPRPGVGTFTGIASTQVFGRLTRARFDAVLIQGWNFALYPLALAAARLRGLPVLVRAESVRFAGEPPAPASTPRAALKRAVLRRYLGACAAALYVSSGNRRLLRDYGVPDARLFASPYAVDGARFALPAAEHRAARAAVRARLGVRSDQPLLLFVGKLQPVKAPALLLDAHAALRESGSDAALCLAGDGPLRESLAARIRARAIPGVTLAGFQNQSELPALYAAADALVLPSVRETFGVVVVEAMHAGLPVVASDRVGCAEDLVTPGRTGEIFPQGDAAALTAALTRLLGSGPGPDAIARCQARGAQARARAATWSYAEATAGLVAALDAVVGR